MIRATEPDHDPDGRVALLADWLDWIHGVHLAYDPTRCLYVDTRRAPVYRRLALWRRRRDALAAAWSVPPEAVEARP